MNEYEKYFEYKVSLRPEDMQVGKNYISDKLSVNVTLKNGKTEQVVSVQDSSEGLRPELRHDKQLQVNKIHAYVPH